MLPSGRVSVPVLASPGKEASLRWLSDFSSRTVSWRRDRALAAPQSRGVVGGWGRAERTKQSIITGRYGRAGLEPLLAFPLWVSS